MFSKTMIGVALGAVFGLLAALHMFWAFGGTWGGGAATSANSAQSGLYQGAALSFGS